MIHLQLECIRFCMRLLNRYAGIEGDTNLQTAVEWLQEAARVRADRIRQDSRGSDARH